MWAAGMLRITGQLVGINDCKEAAWSSKAIDHITSPSLTCFPTSTPLLKERRADGKLLPSPHS